MGRNPIAKTTFATANQNRDYRIFEDFAFFMMEQARKKRATGIFKLKGNVYAFDSTTIPLCLSVFWWAKFRKKKGGVKARPLRSRVSGPGFLPYYDCIGTRFKGNEGDSL